MTGGVARLTVAVLAVTAALGCGSEVPRGGAGAMPRVPEGPRMSRQIEPADLLPGDLDLVVRVDLARMRAGLGPEAARQLSARALPTSGEESLAAALERADVVWVGLRMADVESGDRVVVAEGRLAGLAPEVGADWNVEKTALAGVLVYDRTRAPPRGGTARIVALDERALAFVSPVQVASVDRVLREGPDERRGDPAAEGILSADLKMRPLPWPLANKYRRIAEIIAGVERVRGTVSLVDEGARVEAELSAKNSEAAEKAMKFLALLRDNVEDPRYVELMRLAKLEQVGKKVQLKWDVPARAVLSLVSGEGAGTGAAPPKVAPDRDFK